VSHHFEPVAALPPRVLAREDVREAIARHDFGLLFVLARRWGGISFSRIADATGLKPDRVGRLARGDGAVTSFEKVGAIADGLRIPGRLLGLAARDWESPASNDIEADNVHRGELLRLAGVAALTTAGAIDPRRLLVRRAAQESVLLSRASTGTQIDLRAIDLAEGSLAGVTTNYVATSDIPGVLAEALPLHRQIVTLTAFGEQRPSTIQRIFTLAGASCLLLASLSHDLGESDAAMLQTLSAETFAQQAENPRLLLWVHCTRAMIDLWRGAYPDALAHAEVGGSLRVQDTGATRLIGLEARILASLGREKEARERLHRLENQRLGDSHQSLNLGPLFSFPESRISYYRAVAYAQLGDPAPVEEAVVDLERSMTTSDPLGQGAWPASWALSRVHLAVARLGGPGRNGGPDGAYDALEPIFSLPVARRVNQISQTLAEVENRLAMSAYATASQTTELVESIQEYRRTSIQADHALLKETGS
jgi:hypothetical protein